MDKPEKEKSWSKKEIRNILIPFAIFALFSVMPGIGMITETGMLVIGLFIALLYGWINQVDPWICVGLFLLYSLIQKTSFTNEIFTGIISNSNVWLIAFAFWFVACIRATGLVDYVANKLLSIKLASKGPYYLMTILMLGGYLITALCNSSAVPIIILLMGILEGITNQLKLEQYSKWSVATGMGIAVCCIMGSVAMPYSAMVAIILGLLKSVGVTAEVNLFAYSLVNLITCLVTTAIIVCITKFIIRPQISLDAFKEFKINTKETKITTQMKWAIAAMLVLIAGMALPYLVPSGSTVYPYISAWGNTGSFAAACVLLCLAPDGQGGHLFSFKDKLRDATDWFSLWYLGCIFYTGSLMANNELTGIASFLSWICSPLASMDPLAAVLILILLCCIATNIITNSVCALVFGSVGAALIGANNPGLMAILVVGITFVCNVALAMPSASVNAMVVHSQKKLFKGGQLVGYGFLFCLICALVLCLVLIVLQGLFL